MVFAEQYLDFITATGAHWDEHLASSAVYASGVAPTGVVLSGVRPERAFARLTGASPPRDESYPILRRMETESPIEVAYRFLPLRSQGLPLGLISDSSPEALREASCLEHPNTAVGIASVHLRVPSLRQALDSLAREPLALGPSSADATEVAVGQVRIRLHESTPDDYLGAVSRLLPGLDRPALLALEFRVASLEAAATVLRERTVRFAATRGDLCVDPDQCVGAGIVFRADD